MKKHRFVTRIGINLVLFLGVALLVARCSKNKSTTPGTFTDVYATINTSNCITCHAGKTDTQNGAALDFTTQASAYSSLVNVKENATDVKGECGSLNLVTANSPSASYLEAEVDPAFFNNGAVFGSTSNCVPFNHLANQNLSADELSSITLWINQGAQNN